MNLTGTLPKGGQVKLTAVPEDSWLRPSHIDGDQVTPMALNWTEQSEGGAYAVRGIVPGAYAAAVTTARKERGDKPSTTGANLAATHSTVIVNGPAPTAAFTAPKGAKVRGSHALRPRQPAGDRAVRLPGPRPGRPVLAVPDRLGQAEVRQAVPRRDAARRQGRGSAARPRGAVRRAPGRADPRQPGQLGPQRGRHAVLVHRPQARHHPHRGRHRRRRGHQAEDPRRERRPRGDRRRRPGRARWRRARTTCPPPGPAVRARDRGSACGSRNARGPRRRRSPTSASSAGQLGRLPPLAERLARRGDPRLEVARSARVSRLAVWRRRRSKTTSASGTDRDRAQRRGSAASRVR